MTPKVLIADDATFVREILKTIVIRQGWKVVGVAEDGEDAVQKALELQPDIILMDIVMPKLNGIEAAQKILKKMPGLPIIGLSTMDNEEVMTQALGVGLVSYITKPFENWAIVSSIKEALINKEKQSG